ncbi:hypothetical protein JHK86_002817 [Glycine max]|nr:hypothetical protein JHK86_002817 [Glycine max]
MAFASVVAIVAFLLLQPLSATSDLLSPLLSPIFDDVCKEVECGKGTCKPSKNSTFFFECECHPGWKRAPSNDKMGLKFLPCIVPNCTLDYSCSKAPAPVQEKSTKSNESIFDACHWIDCGGGSCNKTSKFSYSCECDVGYDNLLNVTTFPCFRECSLGLGCSELGISVKNSSTSAPPTLNDNSKNEVQAAAIAAERRLQYEICCGSQSGGDYEVAKNIVQHKGKNVRSSSLPVNSSSSTPNFVDLTMDTHKIGSKRRICRGSESTSHSQCKSSVSSSDNRTLHSEESGM